MYLAHCYSQDEDVKSIVPSRAEKCSHRSFLHESESLLRSVMNRSLSSGAFRPRRSLVYVVRFLAHEEGERVHGEWMRKFDSTTESPAILVESLAAPCPRGGPPG